VLILLVLISIIIVNIVHHFVYYIGNISESTEITCEYSFIAYPKQLAIWSATGDDCWDVVEHFAASDVAVVVSKGPNVLRQITSQLTIDG